MPGPDYREQIQVADLIELLQQLQPDSWVVARTEKLYIFSETDREFSSQVRLEVGQHGVYTGDTLLYKLHNTTPRGPR